LQEDFHPSLPSATANRASVHHDFGCKHREKLMASGDVLYPGFDPCGNPPPLDLSSQGQIPMIPAFLGGLIGRKIGGGYPSQ
jgi:hypothetical protein